MKLPHKKKSHWRWARHAALSLILLLLVAVLIPFLFTTAVVRWAVSRSSYGKFSPQLESASLSLGGTLTVRNLVLHEPGTSPQKELLKATQVRVTFSWPAVISGTVREITADDVTLYARPASDAPISFLQLAAADPVPQRTANPMTAAASADAGKPFWFDKLDCKGHIVVESFDDFTISAATHAFTLSMATRGDPLSPARDLSLLIGDSTANPELTASLHFDPAPTGEKITVDDFTAHNLAAGISENFAKRSLTQWPTQFQQQIHITLDSVALAGVYNDTPGAFAGHILLAGLAISSSSSDPAQKLDLQGFNFVGAFAGPASAEFLKTGAVASATADLQSLAYGKNTLEKVHAPLTLNAGALESTNLTATFAGGVFAGLLQFSTAENKLEKITLTVDHVDQQQVVQNIAPDRLDGEGTLSGTIHLKAGEKTLLKGKIDLTSDGPGHLQIKDKDVAQKLAGQLAVPAGTGIIPANFSDIVVGQLKNYPYKTAHIRLADHEGGPILSLDYARDGVTDGEPGFKVKTTLAGKEVEANYTVQLPGVTVVLKGQTIEQLLKLATGLGAQIAGGNPPK